VRERLATGRARLVASICVVAFVGLALVGLTYTPAFRARHIDVEGERRLTTPLVLRIAGVDADTNVFHLDLGAVEAALRSSPWISDAVVERDLPSTIRIRITEREPVARVTIDGLVRTVAGDGTVLPAGRSAGLPEVRAAAGALDEGAWSSGARALAAMTPSLRARVDAVIVAIDGSLTVQVEAGVTVAYGPPGATEAQAAALHAILVWAAKSDVSLASIDLTVPDAPTATTTDGGTVAP
jgi:cell division protein FtsQ